MKTILIIESDEATRDALRDLLLLEWPHLTILTASSSQYGLAIANRINVDLVIFEEEYVQSNGIAGDVLAGQLRQIPALSKIPLIAITIPNFQSQQVTLGITTYCDAWLLKPFSAERLIRTVSPFAFVYS